MVKEILVQVSSPEGDDLVIFPNDEKKQAEIFIAEQLSKRDVDVKVWRGIVLDIRPRVIISTASDTPGEGSEDSDSTDDQ